CQRADLHVVDLRYVSHRRSWRALLRTALDREGTAYGLTPAAALERCRKSLGYTRRGAELVYQPELVTTAGVRPAPGTDESITVNVTGRPFGRRGASRS